MSELHAQILEIFLSSREQRDAAWEEQEFMEFLIIPNGKPVRNSFGGARRFGRVIDRIEEECCVCFPQRFYDNKWNLPDFVAYVEKRKQKPGVDLRIAEQELHVVKTYYERQLLFLTFVITLPIIMFAIQALLRLPFPIGWVALAVAVFINCLHTGGMLRQASRLKRLIAKLSAETAKRHSGKLKTRPPNSVQSSTASSLKRG